MPKTKKNKKRPPKKGKLKKRRFRFKKLLLLCLLIFLIIHYRTKLSAIILDSIPGQFSSEHTQINHTSTKTKAQNAQTKSFVKISPQGATLYAQADDTSTQLGTVNVGEMVTFLDQVGDYYHITTNNQTTGYVSKNEATLFNQTIHDKPTSLSQAVIVLNPGHGGDDVGAMSNNEAYYEKDVTLSTAKAVKKALEAAGATVIMTRDTDQTESLDSITEKAMANQADAFISFHFDSTDYANSASGVTTYYYYNTYEDLAESINQQLSSLLPLENRGIEYGDFEVIRETTQPSLLLELGYMNNDSDLQTFLTSSYQNKVAKAVVTGLENYFSSSNQ